MNIAYFIASRIVNGQKGSFSSIIIRIAAASVALSVAVMIVTNAMITGFKFEIREKIFGFWGHIHLTHTTANRSLLESVPIEKDSALWTILNQSKWGDQILGIKPYAVKPGIIKAGGAIEGIILKGVGPTQGGLDPAQNFIESGRYISVNEDVSSNDIVISRQTADRLQVEVGDELLIHFIQEGNQLRRRFFISGIYKSGLEEYDREFAIVDIRKIQELLGWQNNQVAGLEIITTPLAQVDLIIAFLQLEVIPIQWYAESIRQKLPEIFEWLDLQDVNEIVIMTLMVIVAVINMITALLILILERTQMIGILKALGSADKNIRSIFLYYSSYIIGMGLFWGNIVGLGVCWAQKKWAFIQLDEANYYLHTAPIKIEWWQWLSINIGTFGITLLFLIIPSLLVGRIHPVRAIKFN
ncbi:MAG: ABC transporter permease [Saprospiraceae bacterium]|jgi:lipoprotein-releasing system permease protein